MRKITVNTTVENDTCDERREFEFKTGRLSASIYLNPDKESAVWANHYESDNTWSISLGNVMISDIGTKDMLRLIKSIQEETEKIDVTSDDNA
jgi:hypothetical protein